MRYRQQIEDYLAKKVETMLAQVIGPGNAVVRVSAEIETDATTLTEEKYDPEGQVVRTQTVTEDTANTTESRNGGVVGVTANVPDKATATPGAEAAKPTSTNEQSRKNRTTTYEINRTTTNTVRTPGALKNLTAAVFVAQRAPGTDGSAVKRTAEELASLRQIVVNALGVHQAAGQSPESIVSLQEMPFQITPISAQVAQIQRRPASPPGSRAPAATSPSPWRSRCSVSSGECSANRSRKPCRWNCSPRPRPAASEPCPCRARSRPSC